MTDSTQAPSAAFVVPTVTLRDGTRLALTDSQSATRALVDTYGAEDCPRTRMLSLLVLTDKGLKAEDIAASLPRERATIGHPEWTAVQVTRALARKNNGFSKGVSPSNLGKYIGAGQAWQVSEVPILTDALAAELWHAFREGDGKHAQKIAAETSSLPEGEREAAMLTRLRERVGNRPEPKSREPKSGEVTAPRYAFGVDDMGDVRAALLALYSTRTLQGERETIRGALLALLAAIDEVPAIPDADAQAAEAGIVTNVPATPASVARKARK